MTDDAPNNGSTIKEKVRRLEEDVKDLKNTVDDVHDGLYGVKGDYITRKDFSDLLSRVNEMDKAIAALKERLTIYNLAQATFTSVIGAIAVIVGALLK